MATQGRLAKVNITGDPIAFTDEATSTTDDQVYTIDNSVKEIWALDVDVVVKDDGVATIEEYTVNKLKGEITFATVDATRGVVTVSGSYLPRVELTEAHEYSLTINGETLDNTKFGSNFTTKQQGLKSAEGSLSEFFNTNQYLLKDLINDNTVVIEFFQDRTDTTKYYRLFAKITSDEISAPVADLVGMSISFESTNDMVAEY
jgi:hypothetical protein